VIPSIFDPAFQPPIGHWEETKGEFVVHSTILDVGQPSRPPSRAQVKPRSFWQPFTVAAMMLIAVFAGATLVVAGLLSSGSASVEQIPTASTAASAASIDAVAASAEGSGVAAASATQLTDVSTIAANVVDSVVTVNVAIDVRGPGELTGSGSGIIVDGDGTVVTNAHVVDGVTSVSATLTDGSTVAASVAGIDTTHDLAVLTIEATGLLPVTFGTTDGLEVGDPVIAVGNPLGLEGGPSVTTGVVSALGRVLEDSVLSLNDIIQTDAAITEGSSGGALLDGEGRLIGVTTAVGVSSVGVEGIGFAIPVETVSSVVAGLMAS
jgi:serine protease Do